MTPKSSLEQVINPPLETPEVITHFESFGGLTNEQLNDLYQEAEFEMSRFRPNLGDFKDQYSEDQIKHDLNYVAFLEQEWQQANDPETEHLKKVSTIAEYLVFKNIHAWTSERMRAIPASEYDDYVNKTDLVFERIVEYKTDADTDTYHAMSIDVVMGSVERLAEKLMSIKLAIDKVPVDTEGQVATLVPIRYFPTNPNQKSSFVRGVISLSPNVVKDLMKKEISHDSEKTLHHSAPYIILIQLLDQYQGFRDYAEKTGKVAVVQEYQLAIDDLTDAFMGSLLELEQNEKSRMVVENDNSVRNTRVFFKILSEGSYIESNPSDIASA